MYIIFYLLIYLFIYFCQKKTIYKKKKENYKLEKKNYLTTTSTLSSLVFRVLLYLT